MNRDRGPLSESRSGLFPEDLPPGRRVEAKVKWFNASKGFGFVTLSDGSQDAFLPMAILRRAGYEDVREGAWITCEISAGAKGPLVTTVLSVDDSTAAASEGVSTPEPVPFERSGDEQDAAAFAAAAEKLLNVVDGTLAEMRQGREETRVLLDRLEVRLGSLHG